MSTKPVTPYASSNSKNQQVREMFNRISNRYDSLNSILSLGVHRYWRKACLNEIKKKTTQPKFILDVATGTGDFALTCLNLNPEKITGMDISAGMLNVGQTKLKLRNIPSTKIELIEDNAETCTRFENTFDLAVVAFGVRNFENLDKGLYNIKRMLKPNGVICVLEFAYPRNKLIKLIYHFYFKRIIPWIGRFFSSDSKAYRYLFESVQEFPHFDSFIKHLHDAGYNQTSFRSLSFGIACCYTGIKKAS